MRRIKEEIKKVPKNGTFFTMSVDFFPLAAVLLALKRFAQGLHFLQRG